MHAQPPARTTCTGHVSGQSAANLHSKQTFFLLLSASSDADSSWRRGIARCAAGAYCWLPCCPVLCGSLHALLDMRRDGRGADGESDCDMLVGADVYCGHEQHGDAWPSSPSHRHKQVAAARAGSCSIPRRKLPRMEMDADESFGPPLSSDATTFSLGRYMSSSYTRVSTMPTAEPTWRVTGKYRRRLQPCCRPSLLFLSLLQPWHLV